MAKNNILKRHQKNIHLIELHTRFPCEMSEYCSAISWREQSTLDVWDDNDVLFVLDQYVEVGFFSNKNVDFKFSAHDPFLE